jgi:hypothetical protein
MALPSTTLVVWLSNELPARQVLPVAWLEKGAKPADLISEVPAAVCPCLLEGRKGVCRWRL